jgi:hypothetical protein
MTNDGFKKLLKKHGYDGSKLPKGLKVGGWLDLQNCTKLKSLPEGLKVGGCLNLQGCTSLTSLPKGLTADGGLELFGCTGLTSLPNDLFVREYLDIQNCTGLTSLPKGLTVEGDLSLRGCTGLTELPEGLDVGGHLNLRGCTCLTSLPNGLKVSGGLDITGCTGLTSLPNGLKVGVDLDIEGCTGLTSLPNGLKVGEDLITDLHHIIHETTKALSYFVSNVLVPEALAKRRLEYKEFRELDAEQRQVWIQMVGVEWLIKNTKPEILDVDDHRINGHRALMLSKVSRTRYCILVCGDPSTGRVYYMEVPPKTKTCQEADAYLNLGLDQRQQVGRT